MTTKVPMFDMPGLTDYLQRQVNDRDRADADKLSKSTANHSLLLISPGFKVYEVTVDDAGTLHATLVAG